MLIPLAAGIDITIRHRTPTGRDSHGNDTFTVVETTYHGCAVWPGSAGRNVAGSNEYGADTFRNSVVTRAQAVLPDDAVVGPQDEAVTPGGVVWHVVGEGQRWTSQLTTASSGVEISLERTEG